MIKKLMILFISMVFVTAAAFGIVTLVFFITPSHKAQASISLPTQIVDTVEATEKKEETLTSGYDNIYLADVHQSLTLRTKPDSNSSPVMEDGLAPMTHMQVLEFVNGSNFAYVEVINGTYKGYTGYVNCDYITRLGEPTTRVWEEE